MREIGAFEAKNKLGQLLDWVQAGEEVLITRRGKPIARLTAPEVVRDRSAAKAAVERIIARSRGVTLGNLKINDLIEEGRR